MTKEIRNTLSSARVAVLLISADFIAKRELLPFLAGAESERVTILPLILKPSRFERIESLPRFQSVNPPSKPLIGLLEVEQEHYLVKLSEDVLCAVEALLCFPFIPVYTFAEGAARALPQRGQTEATAIIGEEQPCIHFQPFRCSH